jgi:hypothetical protein
MTTWTLFDQEKSMHVGHNKMFGDKSNAYFSVHNSGLSAGVETVVINNGLFSIHVLPGRGMNIWKAFYNEGDNNAESIGWASPVRGPVNPALVNMGEPSGLGWLDGFDELLARCGLESNGAPDFDTNGQLTHPLHGKISNKPAYKLELTIDESSGDIALTGWVEESRLHSFKVRMKTTIRTKRNQLGFEIEDEIINISTNPTEIQMLYHMNFGKPLLENGAKVVAPFKEIVPRNNHAASGISNWKKYSAEEVGYQEQVYFATLHADSKGQSSVLLKNAASTRGAYLSFNVNQLPCFTVWKNTISAEDGYVTGIEPGTNYPNPRTFEGAQGRVIKLIGGESTTLCLGFEYCVDKKSVEKAEETINKIQKEPEITHSQPLSGWCYP